MVKWIQILTWHSRALEIYFQPIFPVLYFAIFYEAMQFNFTNFCLPKKHVHFHALEIAHIIPLWKVLFLCIT